MKSFLLALLATWGITAYAGEPTPPTECPQEVVVMECDSHDQDNTSDAPVFSCHVLSSSHDGDAPSECPTQWDSGDRIDLYDDYRRNQLSDEHDNTSDQDQTEPAPEQEAPEGGDGTSVSKSHGGDHEEDQGDSEGDGSDESEADEDEADDPVETIFKEILKG